MRLFIAIDFNELKDYFIEIQTHLPKEKLSMTNSFHLTLKFLGEVQPHNAGKIAENLRQVKFRPFTVSLDSIGVFPDENYARVVWIGLQPEDKVIELQQKIDDALHLLFAKEKDFRAHITLARVKYIEDKKQFMEKLKKIKIENKKLEVKDFRLVKSTLTNEGPVYENVEVFNLS